MTLDEFMALAGTSNTGAGEYVSSGTAESLPAVMNAVTVISDAVATMPCYLYLVRNEKGKEAREWLDSHPVDHILNERPNAWQTPYQFKRMMIRYCLLSGNAYAVIQWGRDGFPAALHPYPPQSVNVEQTGDHNWRYCITDAYTGNTRNYLPWEVLHLRYSTDDGFMGRSPVTICRESLGLGLAQQRHGASVMRDGMMAAGVITSGEWLASRRFTIEDIARMFNVSPIFLQEYSNSTYSNFSEASRAFLTMTMRPWLANFEQQIKNALLVASPVPGIRYQVEFDSADLLRATPGERFATYERGIKSDVMCPNEAREREGLSPRDGGDEFSQAWKQEVKISEGEKPE